MSAAARGGDGPAADRGVRPANAGDLDGMAALAARCQADPASHVIYLGLDAASIAADIGEVPGWLDTTVVAERGGELVGWLLAEVDPDMGRLWWWGPFCAEPAGHDRWVATADALYAAARRRVPAAVAEEEACADTRAGAIEAWCHRHALQPDPASVLLRRDRPEPGSPPGPAERAGGPPPAASGPPPAAPAPAPGPGPGTPESGDTGAEPRIRALAAADHEVVQALHADAFPGTHTTPAALVAAEHPRLVVEVGGAVLGYVAYEIQSDGSGYVDYLAVAPAARGRGLGGLLVADACRRLFAGGATFVHLTVREDNATARALYRRLGFVEERIARPYRRGFRLP